MSTMRHGAADAEPSTVLTPNELMRLAATGVYSKATLASLLTPHSRTEFLAACAAIEKQLTDECAAAGDFCIGARCAVEGEVCLEAVLKAGPAYANACAAEWLARFVIPANRAAL